MSESTEKDADKVNILMGDDDKIASLAHHEITEDDEDDDCFETSKKNSITKWSDQDDEETKARKATLEKRWKRRLVWGSASGAVAVGEVLQKIGIEGAYYRVVRAFLKLMVGFKRLQVPHVNYSKGTIANVKVRIYRPNSSIKTQKHQNNDDEENLTKTTEEKLPCILYIHGGGWMMGSARSYHSLTTRLCRDIGVVVISIDYRLAPEHPYPASLEDCLAVTRAVLDGNASVFSDPALVSILDLKQIALAGDSAGGNLAGAVSLELVRGGDRRLHACALICPVTQAITMSHDSNRRYSRKYGKANLGWFVSIYAGVAPSRKTLKAIYKDRHIPEEQHQRLLNYVKPNEGDEESSSCINAPESPKGAETIEMTENKLIFKNSPEVPLAITELVTSVRAWPALAEDEHLAQLPRMMIQSCSHDVLYDENVQMVERLRKTGSVVVEHSNIEGGQHVEAINCGVFRSKASHKGYRDIVNYFTNVFSESN